eukprot:scaffold5329_cov200-Alexandrium_tamarense.AAC.3
MDLPNLELFYAYNNSLTGALPSENWDNMRKLKVSNNSLTGEIQGIAYMKNLEILSLNDDCYCTHNLFNMNIGNKFHGTISKEIGEMQSLKYLNLQRNHFSGTMPKDLCKLGMLEELRLDDNDLSGVAPPGLCNLRNAFLDVFVSDCGGAWPEVTCSCCTDCS